MKPCQKRQCVILCGGFGTRLGALTQDTPKPMLPVNGRPFIDILIENVARFGFNEFILLAGFRGDLIWHRYCGGSNPLPHLDARIHVVIEREPAGTGGALTLAHELLDEHFLMMNGDSLFDINYLSLVAAASERPERPMLATIALKTLADASRSGVVELDGCDITAFRERPERPGPGLVNGGIYWLSKAILEHIRQKPCSIERDVFPMIAAAGLMRARIFDGFMLDIGIPEDYAVAHTAIPQQLHRPAVFFDRDGTLNKDAGYTHKIAEFEWMEGAIDAIRACNDAGYLVFVVTNQAGVAHGYYGTADVEKLHRWMNNQLFAHGAHIDDFRYCPFHPEGRDPNFAFASPYRKPGPKMLEDLIVRWYVDASHSLMIGDSQMDVDAGVAAGVRSVLWEGQALAVLVSSMLQQR